MASGQPPGIGGVQPVQAVLPWMRLPISIPAGSGVPLGQVHGLHPALRAAVPFSELFPVQAAVWRGLAGGHSTAHDMCICAPTGSGKTLAYGLPLLNAIASCSQQHQLAALVVLPTRDLAVQVHSVLSSLAAPAGIVVALAAAQESVAAEAAKLVSLPGRVDSSAQVLVATPGRLLAHLQGLSLRGLRFLVVDEADRLLRQDYQGWLPELLRQQQQQQQPQQVVLPVQGESHVLQQVVDRNSNMPLLPLSSSSSSSQPRLLKLIVSATLTRDPSKLLRLELHNPRYISLSELSRRYVLPPALQQHRLVVPAQHKPLALLALLHSLAGSTVIIFASSLETTHRLYLLLAAVPSLPDRVAEYSSHVPAGERAAALAAFKSRHVKVLVTSDAMARGMDVPDVAHVVNYDPPTYPKTYIHRAGRTARAGGGGAVYTLLKPEDVLHFNALTRKLQSSGVKNMKLQPAQLQTMRPALHQALAQVNQLLQLEKQQAKPQQPGPQQLEIGKVQLQLLQQQQHIQQSQKQPLQQWKRQEKRPVSRPMDKLNRGTQEGRKRNRAADDMQLA